VRIILTVTLSICAFVAFAQTGKEEKIALRSNPALDSGSSLEKDQPSRVHAVQYHKAPFFDLSFPFVDWFDRDTTELNDSLWAHHLVKIAQGSAVLNAQDSNNITYSSGDGSIGTADVLLSNNINIQSSNGRLFVVFTYSTGNTWKPTDVLSLEFKTLSGVFTSVWSDGNIVAANRQVLLPIDLSLYASDTFAFRFVCNTDRSVSNTAVFLLHNIDLSDKLTVPWYENFIIPDASNTAHASPVNWQCAQPNLYNVGSINGTQNSVFDAYSRLGKPYANNGYGDTLLSQPFDLTSLAITDSVFFRFLYRKYPAANGTDTLLLDFLDSSGQWVRLWQISGTQAGLTYAPFIRQMNIGAYRHANFQFRLINKCDYTITDTLQFGVTGFHIGTAIRLPFIDDFSNVKLYPSSERWKEKQVYINNDFAIAPPSVNVATFDGLDERGNAYGQGEGYLDSLTCIPLNLTGLTRGDSVYLSFYVQPQGLGDVPEPEDSLVLEFRSNPFYPNAWHTVWSGTTAGYSTTAFTKVVVFVDSVYLQDDFQFRFKNFGGKSGNLDNWHLDYVVLDKGRSAADGYVDFSLSSNPPTLLKKFNSMTWKQYSANPVIYTNSVQDILISNNDKVTVPMNFRRDVFNPEGMYLDSFKNTNPGVLPESRSKVAITSLIGGLTTAATGDSLIFSSKYSTNSNNNLGLIRTNDTLNIQTVFSNYIAYDDGTAEAGYGIANQPGSVALGYKLEVPDSIYGISMFFNQSKVDVSTQSFNIMVWSQIGTNGNGTGETVIKRIFQSRPTYKDQRNGFYFLQFEQPIYMPKGIFYIGWEQNSVFNLNMGLDMNYQVNGVTVKNPDMWFKVYNVWAKSQVEGALMMRPILGKWIDPPVGLFEKEKPDFSLDAVVYPNPATDIVYVQTNSENDLTIELFDISGRMMVSNIDHQKSLPLNQLTNGVYFIKIRDLVTGNTLIKKLLINQ
jgi:hypothetical protein